MRTAPLQPRQPPNYPLLPPPPTILIREDGTPEPGTVCASGLSAPAQAARPSGRAPVAGRARTRWRESGPAQRVRALERSFVNSK